MIIDILTLFPEMFSSFLSYSIVKRAIDKGLLTVNLVNFRDYSTDPHGSVDDTPYGGGCGMVLKVQPIYDAVKDILSKDKDAKVILLSPDGACYKQKDAYMLKEFKHLIIICGHYEGFDERIKSIVDYNISIGDFVLTGGEIPSMIIVDTVSRLIDGVINEESHLNDSFNMQDGLLDYPTYTKPREFNGMKVPDVLLSGNHEEIRKYRYEQSLKKTKELRPDLLEK